MADTVAFVTPWYGSGIPGGAEGECRRTAQALAARGVPVEILATCARERDAEWVDFHPEGLTEDDGIPVRRFPVRPRNRERYDRLRRRLELGGTLASREADELVRESIHSEALYRYLDAERGRSWYVFLRYGVGTTWEGALVAPERSILIPCLEDEPLARLRRTRWLLGAMRRVCFHTPAERALGEALFGGDPGTFVVIPAGVDADIAGDGERFRKKYRVWEPFLLYAGRKAPGKHTPLLIDYYTRYHLTHRHRPLKLVLMGPGNVRVPERLSRETHDVGFVPVQDKHDAAAAALAFCQPSPREYFASGLIEAWLAGAPALVHGGCAVTRQHCVASNGGLFFDEYFEFVEAVERLLEDPPLRQRLAENGRAYVREHFTWDRVTARYRELFESLGARLG